MSYFQFSMNDEVSVGGEKSQIRGDVIRATFDPDSFHILDQNRIALAPRTNIQRCVSVGTKNGCLEHARRRP
jgi:hypothetical protein